MQSFVWDLVIVKKMKQTGLHPQVTYSLVQGISIAIKVPNNTRRKQVWKATFLRNGSSIGREAETQLVPVLANGSSEKRTLY